MPGSALEALAGNRSGVLGSDRSPGRLPCSLEGLSSSFLAPRYRFQRTRQALLGLKPCGKRSRGCLPKEP